VGWRCSRGRLGEEVYVGGVGVDAGGHPPQLRLLVPGSSSPAGSRPPSPRHGAASSPSPSLPTQAKVTKRRKPQWGWWLGVRDSPTWHPFEARPRGSPGWIAPCTPGRSLGGAGGARGRRSVSPRMRAVGVIGSLPTPRSIPTPTRTHRPSACGPPGWCGRPVARPCAMRLS
jgi:hypothetical protein